MAGGYEAAFTRVYREHADSIYAYLRYHLPDPELMTEGRSNLAIALELGVAQRTEEAHVTAARAVL